MRRYHPPTLNYSPICAATVRDRASSSRSPASAVGDSSLVVGLRPRPSPRSSPGAGGRRRASRRTLRPVYVSCALALSCCSHPSSPTRSRSGPTRSSGCSSCSRSPLVPLAFLAGVLRSRFDRAAAARMLLSLDAGVPLRDASPRRCTTPRSRSSTGSTTATAGSTPRAAMSPSRSPPHDRAVTTIERNGRRIAALVHDPSLADEPGHDRPRRRGGRAAARERRGSRPSCGRSSSSSSRSSTRRRASFVHLDTECRIVNQNAAAVEAAGDDDEEEIRGRFFWDVFIDEAERDDVIARFRAAAPEHPAAEYENTFVNRRGERRVIFWRSAPLHDEHGRTRGIIAGGIDITARHEEAAGARARARASSTRSRTRRRASSA